MPSGRMRHAKVGPRFAKAAKYENASSPQGPKELPGHAQYYLGGPVDMRDTQTPPALPHSQVHTEATGSPAQPHWMPLEPPPSLTSAPGVLSPSQFPAFHLTLPPPSPRTVSPPLEHPFLLLNPETVPIQANLWNRAARGPQNCFQPAPRRPIDFASIHAQVQPQATYGSDNCHIWSPDIFHSDIHKLSWLDGSISAGLLSGKLTEPHFRRLVKARFTANPGWVDCIKIRSDYWLTDIHDCGLWRMTHPKYWWLKVHVWIASLDAVRLFELLGIAIDRDLFLYNGKECAPSFIWILLLMRRVLMLFPYAQELGFLSRFRCSRLDPCNPSFDLLALSRVVLEAMDFISPDWRENCLRNPPTLSLTCHNGHSNVPTPTPGSASKAPTRHHLVEVFQLTFVKFFGEDDSDCLTSLAVARCTHPLGFFFDCA